MIKNIVIGILVVLSLLLGIYSLVQQAAAEKAQKEAQVYYNQAKENELEAQIQQKLAESNAKEAHHQLLIAEQNLLECSQKKKSRK